MKIGISTSVVERGHSGIGQYLLALLRAFMRHARQHEFVLFVLEEDLPLFEFFSRKMQIVPVQEKFRPAKNDILWHQTELPRLARLHNLDVLHVPSYRRMLWPRPCALVATIHDLAPFHLSKKYDWRRTLYARLLVPYLARRQHQIIAVSECTARDVVKYFRVPARWVNIIPNGVDHDRFYPMAPADTKLSVLARFGLAEPYFLYVARLEHPAKNHVRLIQAFNRFKEQTLSPWQLVLAGSEWQGAEAIYAARQQSAFRDEIHCLGFVPDEDLPALYRAAEVFVYPSLYEGFGLPPIEAMACGCPVICSNTGALPEMTGEAAVRVAPEDVDGLKERMVQMYQQPAWRKQWGSAGIVRARHFHWQRAAAATLEAYFQAVSRAATHHRPLTIASNLG